MKIRRASPEDSAALQAIDKAAKRQSGCPEHWIRQVDSELDLSADFISRNDVYVAEESGELRGFYSVTSGERSGLAELCVAPAHFGTGVGKELFLHAMEKVRIRDLRSEI